MNPLISPGAAATKSISSPSSTKAPQCPWSAACASASRHTLRLTPLSSLHSTPAIQSMSSPKPGARLSSATKAPSTAALTSQPKTSISSPLCAPPNSCKRQQPLHVNRSLFESPASAHASATNSTPSSPVIHNLPPPFAPCSSAIAPSSIATNPPPSRRPASSTSSSSPASTSPHSPLSSSGRRANSASLQR